MIGAARKKVVDEMLAMGYARQATRALALIERGASPERVFAELEPDLARAVFALEWCRSLRARLDATATRTEAGAPQLGNVADLIGGGTATEDGST